MDLGIFRETARTRFWEAALDQFEANPILGAGSRAYSWLSRLYRPSDLFTAEGEIEFAHSEYLQLAADYGLVGLLLFVAAVSLCFVNVSRSLWRGRAGSKARIVVAVDALGDSSRQELQLRLDGFADALKSKDLELVDAKR